MSIASLTSLQSKIAAPAQTIDILESNGNSPAFRMLFSRWQSTPNNGATPSTAAVPSRTIAGAFGQGDSATTGRLARLTAAIGTGSGTLIVCDRLSHQGSLDGTVTSAQTTNLPTAALTRYTSGTGVMLGLEIYSAIGATGTTVTASYTDDAGHSGHTTQATTIGGTNFQEAGRLILLPLQQGDSGVTAVASVTLAGTTGTAGNFGVTLFKPLYVLPMLATAPGVYVADGLLGACGNLEPLVAGACLWFCEFPGASSSGTALVRAHIIDD